MDPSQERDRALIKQGLEKAAQERNVSYDTAVSQVAQESREHVQTGDSSGDSGGALVPQIVSSSSDGDGHKVAMGQARYRGMFFTLPIAQLVMNMVTMVSMFLKMSM